MKLLFTIITLILFNNVSFQKRENFKDKEFEGKIVYEVSIKSKTDKISTKDLQNIYGTKMTKYFKNGNFKMEYNGEQVQDIYYLKKENKEFDLRKGIDTLFITSYSTENRKLIKSTSKESEIVILNKKCKLLIHEIGNVKNYYWYNQSLFINPENYKDTNFSFINVYYKQTKAPWLKYKYEGENFEINYTAISISEEKLDGKLFNLPNFPKSYIR